jgi:hypothetical protein
MKTQSFKLNWLSPVLGIALVGSGYALARSYLGYEEEMRAQTQSGATVDRLLETCHLGRARAGFYNTECEVQAARLDELLAANVTSIKVELPSVDRQTQALAESCFKQLNGLQAQNSATATALAANRSVSEGTVH